MIMTVRGKETLTADAGCSFPCGSNTYIYWDLLRGHQHQITDNERYGEKFFIWVALHVLSTRNDIYHCIIIVEQDPRGLIYRPNLDERG